MIRLNSSEKVCEWWTVRKGHYVVLYFNYIFRTVTGNVYPATRETIIGKVRD